MKLIIATDSFPPKIDGVSQTAQVIARHLADRGHEVHVIAPAPGPRRLGGAEVERLPSIPLPPYPELRLTSPRSAIRVARELAPDVAIVLTPGPLGASIALGIDKAVRVIHIHTTDITSYVRMYGFGPVARPFERVLRAMSERSAFTLCPTERVRRQLESRRYPRLVLWSRGVDAELFRPEARSPVVRSWLTGGQADRPLVLYVGRLAREKGLVDLFRAAQLLKGVRFALVGDGPQRDQLERMFASIPSVFTGYLRGEQLAAAFASADVFAFPSVTDTFGQVVLQSMASGVPVVVAAGTAPAELAPEGVAGLHAAPRDPESLASAIATLVLDGDRRQAMGAAARERAVQFSWTALVDQLEGMLTERPREEALIPA